VAIGGGGFIPARILRTFVKVPILAVGLRLYDDATKTAKGVPQKTQWFDQQNITQLAGKRVLIVDEVDDTRITLAYCVQELQKHLVKDIAIFVVYNKMKDKKAEFPSNIVYIAGENIPDAWCCFPWDTDNIEEHDKQADNQRIKC